MCHEVGQRSVLHQFTDLRTTASIPRRLIGLAGSIASQAIIAADLATDRRRRPAQRPRDRRIDLPATTPREISSRSIRVSAAFDRCRSAGRIPPDSATMRWIDEW